MSVLKPANKNLDQLIRYVNAFLMCAISIIGFFLVRELKAADRFKEQTRQDIHEMDQRIDVLEQTEAMETERWVNIERYMRETRDDVRTLKAKVNNLALDIAKNSNR